MDFSKLAIEGGKPVIKKLPYRKLFGKKELKMVSRVFEESWKRGKDFGYDDKFEKMYADRFCEFQRGGFADAVCSGTAALYIALAAFGICRGDEVIFSPVTDPGGIMPAIIQGVSPVVADSQPNSFNIGPKEFEAATSPNTRLAVITHLGGIPVDIEPILEIAASKGIEIIEDCSQSHGALYKGERVGRFGKIAIFSTMFSKNHATGGCGGVIYTRDEKIYRRIKSSADRGKPFFTDNFNPKDPDQFLFPALNLNQDELSCAIGISTLSRLQGTIERRRQIVKKFNDALSTSSVVSPAKIPRYAKTSPFFYTVEIDTGRLKVTKNEFAETLLAEGVWVNPDYKYVVSEWSWIKKYLKKPSPTPNATNYRNRTFNILFNERFGDCDIRNIARAVKKVEKALAKTR